MEDKHLYNKVMIVAFVIIVVLLVAGIYSRGRWKKAEFYVPRGTVQEVEADCDAPGWLG